MHRIPLSKTALHIIATRAGSSRFLFPSQVDGQAFNGFRRAKANLDAALGIDHFTLHDLRRTFSSNLARLGTPIHVTEKLLNHATGSLGGVAGVYNRYSYVDEMREAVEKHDTFLANLMKQ